MAGEATKQVIDGDFGQQNLSKGTKPGFPRLLLAPGCPAVPRDACISDIKNQVIYKIKKSEHNQDFRIVEADHQNLHIYNGIVLVRDNGKGLGVNYLDVDKKRGKKGKLTSYSKRSRLNMMKHLGMLKNRPEFWFDFTYTDDVMEGLSIEERKSKSSSDLNKLNIWASRNGIDRYGCWKREWEPRKSGKLKGQHIPHFHFVISMAGASDLNYQQIYFRMADKWLDITGAEGKYKSDGLRVLYHEKSYRFIKSQKQMRKYMQKYITKSDELVTDESIGRSWGIIGDAIDHDPEIMEMENDEMVLLKRMLRKLCKGMNRKVKYGLSFCLKHTLTKFFVLMDKQTVYQMLEFIREGTLIEGLAF